MFLKFPLDQYALFNITFQITLRQPPKQTGGSPVPSVLIKMKSSTPKPLELPPNCLFCGSFLNSSAGRWACGPSENCATKCFSCSITSGVVSSFEEWWCKSVATVCFTPDMLAAGLRSWWSSSWGGAWRSDWSHCMVRQLECAIARQSGVGVMVDKVLYEPTVPIDKIQMVLMTMKGDRMVGPDSADIMRFSVGGWLRGRGVSNWSSRDGKGGAARSETQVLVFRSYRMTYLNIMGKVTSTTYLITTKTGYARINLF